MGRCKVGSVGTDFACQYWLSLDPCGLFCLSLSVTLHLFALVGAGQTLISHHVIAQCIYAILYIPAFIMSLWSLTMATTTNPGAVPMGARPLQSNLEEAAGEDNAMIIERDYIRGGLRRRRGVRRCHKCNDNYKPSRAHHDSVTGRCIVKMDHFCPWVGNAVGIYNHKFFILFIFYTFLTSIVSLILIIIRVIRCQYYIPLPPPSSQHLNNNNNNSTYLEQFISATTITPTTTIPTFQSSIEGCSSGLQHSTIIFILSIITVLFLLFTFCMLIEQSMAITTNMSKIARMKTTQRGLLLLGGGLAVDHPSSTNEYAPVATEFNEIFGSEQPRLSWHWFIPLPVHFPEWAIDNIMGYEEPSGENEYDEDGRVVGPYREESSVTDDGESDNLTTRSSLGISSLIPSDDDDDGVGGGTVMTFDVEEGNRIQQHQNESMPHEDKNIITPVGERRLAGIKRRSNNSPPLPLV